LNNLKEI